MVRHRRPSTSSSATNNHSHSPTRASHSPVRNHQELGSMYDYLAKIILLGPSNTGKSCLLHRFVKSEWRILSSQTIGVEFASKIVKVGTGSRRKRIKLQLWDTAGTERFRSVSRSYYRGAAGALLVYDVSSRATFDGLRTFLDDARALASPELVVMLVGNKSDLAEENRDDQEDSSLIEHSTTTPSSLDSKSSSYPWGSVSSRNMGPRMGSHMRATVAEGREVGPEEASRWASRNAIPVNAEVSALSGEGVDEIFNKLARTILTRIELGEIDPDDPMSGIQYGDSGGWGGTDDSGSIKSNLVDGDTRRRRGRKRGGTNNWSTGLMEWEEVFKLAPSRNRTCC
ncbi:hypothetical protein AAFC00_002640 [Neodothiora populina]|uniref:Ras-domain-containing protein n=1 Tax=Neodothiora populina TaxID=2781224 RepID=A0ABR3P815_9PEZI